MAANAAVTPAMLAAAGQFRGTARVPALGLRPGPRARAAELGVLAARSGGTPHTCRPPGPALSQDQRCVGTVAACDMLRVGVKAMRRSARIQLGLGWCLRMRSSTGDRKLWAIAEATRPATAQRLHVQHALSFAGGSTATFETRLGACARGSRKAFSSAAGDAMPSGSLFIARAKTEQGRGQNPKPATHRHRDGAVVGAQLDEGADGGRRLGAAGDGGAVGGGHYHRVLGDVPDPREVALRQLHAGTPHSMLGWRALPTAAGRDITGPECCAEADELDHPSGNMDRDQRTAGVRVTARTQACPCSLSLRIALNRRFS